MKKYLFILILLLLVAIVYAQDPGIPDTVNFGNCQSYIVSEGDSLYGKVKVPLRIFNDEPLAGVEICLEWKGPLRSDTLVYYGKRGDSLDLRDYVFDDSSHFVGIFAISFVQFPADTGMFLYMLFEAFDTGFVLIDTTNTPSECNVSLITPDAWHIVPHFEDKKFLLAKSDTIPGDLNGNNAVNFVDILILVEFLFRNQYQGFLLPAADVNSDCQIRLSDVVFLINYIFRDTEKPRPGCAF
ncbi:MAG: hypothetical protein RBG1_1C00001G1872 [candidate division Zixibacteria bacterium RBG-1]|nr:MAG: hypothetical protein RBG1_1C00001G1872 [candidate division Zixibacteria bacterium RBG-1]OGC83997.1 MAG: hypothetical protein A2V73_06360 [candidate division Zixibacteria bacterium RBG_19FT_COMBO_42_43]